MSSSTTALSRTLKSITITKIAELEKQRKSFAVRKNALLKSAERPGPSKRQKVLELLKGVEELDLPSSSDVSLLNMKRWLDQSDFDDSIPEDMLQSFDEQLRSQLDVQTRRLDLADLYSRLLREWLNSSNADTEADLTVDDSSSLDGSFELVERDRLKSLREKFEAVVFTPLEMDEIEIDNYLAGLFDGDNGAKALERLRSKTQNSERWMFKSAEPFDETSLRWCLKGLLANDLLSDEKKSILHEFLKDEVARGEICDVLNMKFRDIKNWTWDAGDEGMLVEPRKQLNGKYRIMMDEDVLQAIFLHYIGVTWSVSMKTVLSELIRYTRLWKQNTYVPQEEKDKRRYYLGDRLSGGSSGVEYERQDVYREDFFLSQLPSSVYEGAGGYDDDKEIGESGKKSPKEIQQQLLRQLATEVHMRRCLDGEAAIVQSDFQWFATSLSHNTITAVLRFVGVSEDSIVFFKKFLEAPLNLSPVSDESNRNEVRIRKRGVPMAHALEKFFGELVLFFLDLAVNQETGTLLYRFHDDLWLCGKPDDCARAWKSMEQFSAVMGLEFNRKKTGSVYLVNDESERDPDIVAVLPQGAVSVGFLNLDPSTGDWIINQQDVDAHVTQLQKQLSKCTSVLSWVQTWNSCIGRFFGHSFGEPSNCFGRAHVDSILDTHKRMQRRLFNGEDGNGTSVTDHLKQMIERRFGVTDVPDAFIFLPEQLGGLGVRNPFIASFLVRDEVYKNPSDRLKKFLKEEKEDYEDGKRMFEEMGELGRRRHFRNIYTNEYGEHSKTAIAEDDLDKFFSFDDFTRSRERLSLGLCRAYKDLMRVPVKQEAVMSRKVKNTLAKHARIQPELEWGNLDPEMKWLLQLHSEELFAKCGELSIVDKNLLPLGILTILRKRKVGWQMVL